MILIVQFLVSQVDPDDVKAKVEEARPFYDHIMVIGHKDEKAPPFYVYAINNNQDMARVSPPSMTFGHQH